MSKQFISTKTLVRCVEPGKRKTRDEEAVAPKIEEVKAGTSFKATDFTKEEFTAFTKDGTLVEVDGEGDNAAAAYYDSQNKNLTASGELVETPEKRLERLSNEAKTLGVPGITKNMKAETIEAKIAEFKNKREDGTTPSIQEGAGRANASEGTTGGEGAGGNADGTSGPTDEDVLG